MEQGLGRGYGPGGRAGLSAVRLVWVYPDLLSTYGDRGNLLVLARRAGLRGIPVEIAEVNSGQRVPAGGDIYLLGGGEDLPQVLAARRLRADGGLAAAAGRGAVIFAVCAGYQIVGAEFAGADAAVVKLFCTEMQGRVVDRCLQLFGGYGYIMEFPIARLYADARVSRIYGGTSEVMKSIISKSLGL